MLYHLDALAGGTRAGSPKFRFLERGFDPQLLPREYAWEIAVVCGTHGIEHDHVRSWLRWSTWTFADKVRPILDIFGPRPDVIAAAHANAGSIRLEDGRDMLMARRAAGANWLSKAKVGDTVPVWGLMWIEHENREVGRPLREIAEEVGVSMSQLMRWRGGSG